MLRLTLRNLFARKVRLAHERARDRARHRLPHRCPDLQQRAARRRSTASSRAPPRTPSSGPAGTDPSRAVRHRQLDVAEPAVVERPGRAARGRPGRRQRRRPRDVPARPGRASSSAVSGAPTLAFNYTDTPNLLDEPTLELVDRRLARRHRRGRARHRRRRERRLRGGRRGRPCSRPTATRSTTCSTTLTLAGTAEFNGGGTAGATLLIFSTEGAQQFFLDGRDVFTSAALTAAPGVTQRQLADAADEVAARRLRGGRRRHGGGRVQESAIGEFLDVITSS